jgi:hypothetical protein
MWLCRVSKECIQNCCGNLAGNVYLEGRKGAEDNIKRELKETGCEDRRWMKLAQNRVQQQILVLAVLNLLGFVPTES